jgi:hypothetical protein
MNIKVLIKKIIFNVFIVIALKSNAQVFGPNSPTTATNFASAGVNAWTTPTNVFTSNNGYAFVGTKGATNYIKASDFGFAIPVASNIDGIVVEIEKKTLNPNNVALLDAWTTGLTKTISGGQNRALIVVVAIENGTGTRDVTGITYGGQAMTQIAETFTGTAAGFTARVEAWVLLEAGIAAAAGTAIVPSYGAHTPLEYCETFSSVTFQHVDQLVPVTSQQVSSINGSTNPHQLGAAITTSVGSMAVNVVMCGNNTTAASLPGATTAYTINSGYTEGVDVYFSNPSFSGSGACFQAAHKAIAVAGTEQPSCGFMGSVNRHAMIGFTLQRARELDSYVGLLKALALVGVNLGQTATAWPTTDTYISYGSPSNLWSTSWTPAQINSSGFGAAIGASVSNGTAQVDHIRITVYVTSTLPITLLSFDAFCEQNITHFKWATATETNNDYFEIEQSLDGVSFNSVARIKGALNSNSLLSYEYKLPTDFSNQNYLYRLKQVDIGKTFSYSKIINGPCKDKHSDLNIYPNPSENGIYNLSTNTSSLTNEIYIYDTSLKLMKKQILSGANSTIDLSDLADGSYYAIYSNDGKRSVKLIQKISRDK